MDINLNRDGDVLTIALVGRLDTNTALELDKVLADNLSNTKELIFDFAKLDYLSSAGLRIMLTTHKTMIKAGKMVIKHVNELIMETFDMTGFSSILNIEEE